MRNKFAKISTLFIFLLLVVSMIPVVNAGFIEDTCSSLVSQGFYLDMQQCVQDLTPPPFCDAFSDLGDTTVEVRAGNAVTFMSTFLSGTGNFIESTGVTYQWDLGDGVASTQAFPAPVIYSAPGLRNVQLLAFENGNPGKFCTDSITVNVLPMDTPPLADILLAQNPAELIKGLPIAFVSIVSDLENDLVSYLWNFGDGSTSTDKSPSHIFASSGSKTVSLLVAQVNDPGKFASASMIVDIKDDPTGTSPVVTIVASQRSGANPLFVTFATSIEDASKFTFQWDFGDGSTSTDSVPSHVFINSGAQEATFTVSLMVIPKDNPNVFGTDSVEITVSPSSILNTAPVIQSVFGNPPVATLNEPVVFTTVANDFEGDFLSYRYDFGDGSKSTETQSVQTHAYSSAGAYNVVVTVTDSHGDSASAATLVVVENSNLPPVAIAVAAPTSGPAPLPVAFIGSGIDTDGRISSYNWDFGDGTISNQQNPVHLYSLPGIYRATLVVFDNDGAQSLPEEVIITVSTEGVNLPPLVEDIPDMTAVTNVPFGYQVVAHDDPIDVLFFSAVGLPQGLTIGSNTGLIAGIPTQVGVNTVTVTVTDMNGASDSDSFTLTTIGAGTTTTVPEEDKLYPGVTVTRARLVNGDYLDLGELLITNVKVLNDGDLDLQDVQVRVSVPELGLTRTLFVRDLRKMDADVSGLTLELPNHAPNGQYSLRIVISNDHFNRVLHRTFDLE